MLEAAAIAGLFLCPILQIRLQYLQEVSMTADNEKMKLELFKTILANPSNNLGGLNVGKAVEAVEKMMQAIVDPKLGTKPKATE